MAKIDDSVKKKVPELRFPGFTDDWEERKLGSLTTVVRGASPRPIQDPKWFDKESDIGWLRIADVTEQNGRIYHLEQHISKLGQEKTRVLTEPHLLLSIAATVGKPVVNYVKTGVHDGFLIFLNPTFEREFMFQWLEMFRPKWQKYGQPGSQVNLNSELVRNQEIVLPNYKEQQKIGSFFKQLDNTIALHQRKLDLLKEQKKGFLQKMFPKNGAKIPELRFAGFADDWEQRKLGDLSQDTIGGGTPKTSVTEYWNGEIPWIQSSDLANDKLYGVLPKKFITEDAVKNSATKLIPANSIAIVTRVGVGKLAFMPYEFASSQDFLSLSNLKVDCNFGMYSIYKMLQRELNNIQGTSIKGITKADLLDKEIFVPIKVEEQRKIGSFLKQLDGTIALHQRKLHLLKEQKKGFLQKMFV